MPFDFKNYDAKCAAMDQDALQREWEHYTRLISGAAASTAVSGVAIPFTMGVSVIGIGFSTPAIHNARKKREIIEKHLRKLGATHNTRKRDVLTPVAVSGTMGLLTLGCCHAGTDAIVNKAAEHSIVYIAENEVAVKVGTHLALETVAVSAEEAHASHKKEKESLKAYAKLVKAGKVSPPSHFGPDCIECLPSRSQRNPKVNVDSKDASYPLPPYVSPSAPFQYIGSSNLVHGSYFPPPPESAQPIQLNSTYLPSPVYTPDGKFPTIFNEAIYGYNDLTIQNSITPFTPLSPSDILHDQFASTEDKVPHSHAPVTTVAAVWHDTEAREVDNVVATFSTLRVNHDISSNQRHHVPADTNLQSDLHKLDPIVQKPVPGPALPMIPPFQHSMKPYFPPLPSPQSSQQIDCTVPQSIVSQQIRNTYEPRNPQIIKHGPFSAQSLYDFRPVQQQGYWSPSTFDQPMFQTNNTTQHFPKGDVFSLPPSGVPHVRSQPQSPVPQVPQEYYIHPQYNDISHNHRYHTLLPAGPPLTGTSLPAEYSSSTSYNPASYNPAEYHLANYDPSTYSVPAYDPAMYAQHPFRN